MKIISWFLIIIDTLVGLGDIILQPKNISPTVEGILFLTIAVMIATDLIIKGKKS